MLSRLQRATDMEVGLAACPPRMGDGRHCLAGPARGFHVWSHCYMEVDTGPRWPPQRQLGIAAGHPCDYAAPACPCLPPLQALAGADYVVEAVPEVESLKRHIFQQLDGLLPAHAFLASNTRWAYVAAWPLCLACGRHEEAQLTRCDPLRRCTPSTHPFGSTCPQPAFFPGHPQTSLHPCPFPPCPFPALCSSISITRLAASTQRPDRVVGLHFMNPVGAQLAGASPVP